MNKAERDKVLDEVLARLNETYDKYSEYALGYEACMDEVEQMKREGGGA